MKCLLAPIAVVAALAVASCGSSSTLSSEQFTGLQDQGKQFAKSMETVSADASSCAAGASAGKGANTPPDVNIVKTCLASALVKSQAGLTKIIDYTDNLAGEVDGTCSTDLKALTAAMTDVKATFAKAEAQARKLDLDAVSASTKVARRFLESMEEEAWSNLPAATFVRGYLRVVIRTLELCPVAEEAEEAVQGYMARFHRDRD